MRTEVVEYENDGHLGRFTVAEATVLIGIKRSRLRVEGERAMEEDPDRRILRIYTYPDVCAAVVDAGGLPWPPDFETFLGFPDGLDAKLEEAIYRLNPHWLPEKPEGTEDPKAPAPASTSGSESG